MDKLAKLDKLQNQMYDLADDKKIFDLTEKNHVFFEEIADSIIQACQDKNFYIVYQSHISTKTNNIRGAEALCRLSAKIDGESVEIKPYALFLIANYFGFDKHLSLALFDQVVKDTHAFKKQIDNEFITSFNINPSLFDEDMCTKILEIIDQHNLPRKNIAIELVEHSGLENITEQMMKHYKTHGLRLYLDDFGTGYSNQSKLDLPFDVVKFGGQLIDGIAHKPQNQQIVKNTTDICRQKEIITIAEHVENQEDLETIKKCKIDYVQGYIFNQPLTFEEFIGAYSKQNQSGK